MNLNVKLWKKNRQLNQVIHVKSLEHSTEVRGHGQPEGSQSWSRTLQQGRQGFELTTPRLKVQTLCSHKHEGELQSVQTEHRICLPVSGLVSVCLCVCLPELYRRFLARPPRGWRLECWHNRCCLTKPIIICCTAVCPYPLFLLPLLPLHILLRLLTIYVSSSWSVAPLHPQTFTPACENYIYLSPLTSS